jgi:hypothetical protein
MSTVCFAFDSTNGTPLVRFQLDMNTKLLQLGEKVTWAAKSLIDRPDDPTVLERVFRNCQVFGEHVCSALVPTLSIELPSNTIKRIEDLPTGSRLSIRGDWYTHRLPWESAAIGKHWLGTLFSLKRVVTWASPTQPHVTAHGKDLTVFLGEAHGLVGTASECNLAEDWMRTASKKFRGLEETRSLVTTPPSPQRLLERLANSSVLHYSGHGKIDPSTKQRAFAPIDSDQDSLVTSSEILELSSVPSCAYLNGCGLLAHTDDPKRSGRELPLAFLQAGTRWLIGPTIPFLTYRYFELIRAYYRHLDPLSWGPAEAMRMARSHLAMYPRQYERELPLALSTVVYGPDLGWSLFDTLHATPSTNPVSIHSSMTYPTHCSRCNTEIQTKFGNYATHAIDPPLCRACAHSPESVHPFAETVTASPTAFGAINAPTQKGPSQSDTTLTFRRKLLDDATQHTKHYSIARNGEIPCVVRRIVPKKAEPLPERPLLKSPAITGHWTEYFEIAQADRLIRSEPLGTIVVRFEEPLDGIPMNRSSLEAIFCALDEEAAAPGNRTSSTHRFHIVVCSTGFDTDAWSFIKAPGIAWRKNHRSLIIHDPVQVRTEFPLQDREAYSMESFFQSKSIDEQFTQVITWLESQLPLRESLSVQSISTQTKFSKPIIESALRIFAHRHGLAILESKDFGICVEDSMVARQPPTIN